MKINIVMVEPEIPQNTGNVARTCAATGAKLHLVKPLGFEINDKYLKRAGLDYWDKLEIEEHENLNEFLEKYKNELEYMYIRFLLGSSFLRMVKIKDKKIRKELLQKTIDLLYEKFPNWKSNTILKTTMSNKNLYYKTVNKVTFKFYCFIFSII